MRLTKLCANQCKSEIVSECKVCDTCTYSRRGGSCGHNPIVASYD